MKKILLLLSVAMLAACTTIAATTYRYGDVVQTVRGDAVGGATVTVYLANTTTLASLYSGVAETYPALTNPTYTDSHGRYSFYAAEGTYDIEISGPNVEAHTVEDVTIVGPPIDGVFNVKAYGAVGDGVTDDSGAVESALNAADSVQDSWVYFPPGTYTWGAPIVLNSVDNIRMYGPGVCKIDRSSSTSNGLFRFNNCSNITVEGMTLDGSSSNSSYNGGGTDSGLRFYGECDNASVRECKIFGFDGDAIYFGIGASDTSGTDGALISNTEISDCNRNGISIVAGGNITVSGCRFTNIYGSAIDLESDSSGPTDPPHDVTIGNSVFSCNRSNAMGSSLNFYPRAIDVASPVGYESNRVVISGNAIDYSLDSPDTSSSLHNSLIYISASNNIVISGNTIKCNRVSSSTTYGLISILRSAGTIVDGVDIIGPSVNRASGTWGLSDAILIKSGTASVSSDPSTISCRVSGRFNNAVRALFMSGLNISVDTSGSNEPNQAVNISNSSAVRITGTANASVRPIVLGDDIDGVIIYGMTMNNTAGSEDIYIYGTGTLTGIRVIGCMSNLFSNGYLSIATAGSPTILDYEEIGCGYSLLDSSLPWTARADTSYTTKPRSLYGTGSPEGVVTAPIGSTYQRTDGGAGTSLYVKESGTGNTGWVAK